MSTDPSAFPQTILEECKGGPVALTDPNNPGMSLRDYFAAKVAQGICAHPDTWGVDISEIATSAYKLADAMLAARQQPPTP